jgi:hypothetical protein
MQEKRSCGHLIKVGMDATKEKKRKAHCDCAKIVIKGHVLMYVNLSALDLHLNENEVTGGKISATKL